VTPLVLRDASADDVELLYSWRNEPAARHNSFNREVIESDAHRRWFAAKLAAHTQTRIWILTDDGIPVGQVRYERRGEAAEISFSIDSRFRGRGLGTAILKLSAPKACQELGVHEVRGLVKVDNTASIAAFERAGFRRNGERIVNDDRAFVFSWSDDVY